jgi:hypothetical protein
VIDRGRTDRKGEGIMNKAMIIVATLVASLGTWQLTASAGPGTAAPATTTTDITFT